MWCSWSLVCCCVEWELFPSFYSTPKTVWRAIFRWIPACTAYACLHATTRWRRHWAAPGGRWPTLHWSLLQPSSRGGLLSGCGLLFGWSFTKMTGVDGPFHLFFAHVCFTLRYKAPCWCIFPCICVSVCFVVFLVHFRYISCTILICPPAIGQTPKLVEIISSKALCLSLVFIWAYFIRKLAVRNWG